MKGEITSDPNEEKAKKEKNLKHEIEFIDNYQNNSIIDEKNNSNEEININLQEQ